MNDAVIKLKHALTSSQSFIYCVKQLGTRKETVDRLAQLFERMMEEKLIQGDKRVYETFITRYLDLNIPESAIFWLEKLKQTAKGPGQYIFGCFIGAAVREGNMTAVR